MENNFEDDDDDVQTEDSKVSEGMADFLNDKFGTSQTKQSNPSASGFDYMEQYLDDKFGRKSL